MTDAKKNNATPRESETKEAFEAAFDNCLERSKKIFPETNKVPFELMEAELGMSEYAIRNWIVSHCEETNLRFNGGHVYRRSEEVAATAPRLQDFNKVAFDMALSAAKLSNNYAFPTPCSYNPDLLLCSHSKSGGPINMPEVKNNATPRLPATVDEMREIIRHVARYFSEENYFMPSAVFEKIADVASENEEGRE